MWANADQKNSECGHFSRNDVSWDPTWVWGNICVSCCDLIWHCNCANVNAVAAFNSSKFFCSLAILKNSSERKNVYLYHEAFTKFFDWLVESSMLDSLENRTRRECRSEVDFDSMRRKPLLVDYRLNKQQPRHSTNSE